ncbi:MAG: glycoside hydrolase family 2 TIM barrel-domain containing protein [Bacteroidota bacterium]|uniref:Beta-glucuronidase n=1 Tax=Flagellimonas profundi TaxID=2915620 RepID=A0ABS3FBM9_9FLAO|nr:glycoside hydrolase family 2 TIM barrel-domain containing protein [Allomuricauda profundi]MBO0340381.1 beta-glucuronidase [Allomuricauda profundi]MEC7770323.1 glycoside hydrolase family 2 TIM barrel-domain containing protein [Bacteroidota bacterium]
MLKNNYYIILLVVFVSVSTQAQDIFITNTQNRDFVSLNGKWKYVLDPYQTGGMGGMPVYKNYIPKDKSDRVEYGFNNGKTLWVPGSWNTQHPELTYFEGNIWYRRTFDKEDLSEDNRYFVHIGAANYRTTVTFNGEVLGSHEGGFTPFSFEITDLIKKEDNFLIIGVDNTRADDNIPSKVADWFNHGGIIRDVKLIETPSTFINNYFISLDASTLDQRTKQIKGNLELNGSSMPKQAQLIIPELRVNQDIAINPDGTAEFNALTKGMELWSPKNPKLYEVTLVAGKDTIRDQIGFRTIEIQEKQIVLNGKPIFLKGICLHDENPLRKDRANAIEDAELVLGWAQELGCNFIRLAHYPHQENIVRLADKLGILLWEELPLYWGIQWDNPEVLEKAKKQYTEMIDRDFNRASTVIWSIANETASIPDRNNFLGELADYIRSIDDTRLLSAAIKKDQELDGHPDSVYTYNDPLIEKLDIISINEYLGWYGGAPEETRKKSFEFGFEKPVIVSEFGGGALQGFYGDKRTRWSEEFQEYLYQESLAMFDKIDGLSGMAPWILVDFMSPLRQLPGVQDGWNRKGLISEKGRKKKAFFVLQKYYDKK